MSFYKVARVFADMVDDGIHGLNPSQLRYDEPMSHHTTFAVGGPADVFIMPEGLEQLVAVIAACNEHGLPFFVLGNGSNLLVMDKGIRGLVISLGRLNNAQVSGDNITAQSGVTLRELSLLAYRRGLSGLEFAHGIPGSVGGGVIMNAGAYEGDISQVLSNATLVSRLGEVYQADLADMRFGYRHSAPLDSGDIIYSATFALKPAEKADIFNKIEDLHGRRVDKQPLEHPSAGSTFKRPKGYFAGKLIMDAGLRGCSIGRAAVSDKHCGFVVNKGGATAADILRLIEHVQNEVYKAFEVELVPEVRIIGER